MILKTRYIPKREWLTTLVLRKHILKIELENMADFLSPKDAERAEDIQEELTKIEEFMVKEHFYD